MGVYRDIAENYADYYLAKLARRRENTLKSKIALHSAAPYRLQENKSKSVNPGSRSSGIAAYIPRSHRYGHVLRGREHT